MKKSVNNDNSLMEYLPYVCNDYYTDFNFFFFFISGDLSAATKTKYQTYLKEFENQRGHVETIPALDQNRNNVTLFLKSKFEAAGLTVHLQNFSSTETNTKLVSIVYLVY
jgi:hypothetical protein